MTHPIPLTGGREVHQDQNNPLYVFEPERVPDGLPRDHKGWPVHAIRLNDERPACGSRKASKPGLCESPFRYPNGRCKKHGGSTPKGAAHPNFRDGRRSKYASMPQHLREKYEKALQDPELSHHRGQIAMVDSLVDEFFGEYEHGANPETWKAVRTEYRRMKVANNAGNRHKAREHFEALGLLVEEGHSHAQGSLTLIRLLEARRKHAESETKRRLSESMTFTYEMAYTYYTALGSAARRWFGHDQERLTGFLNEITAISSESGLDTTPGGDGPDGGGEQLPPAVG